MRNKEELKTKVKELRKVFGGNHIIVPSIDGLIEGLGKDYVDLFKKGTKAVVDISLFKKVASNSDEWKKRFKDDWQPITITYRRQDAVFFTWDNYPKYKEEYMIIGAADSWNKRTYLREIKLSEVFSKKIKRLVDKNFDELVLQLSLNEFDNVNGHVTIINDIEEYLV